LKKSAPEDDVIIRSKFIRSTSPEAVLVRASEDHQELRELKLQRVVQMI